MFGVIYSIFVSILAIDFITISPGAIEVDFKGLIDVSINGEGRIYVNGDSTALRGTDGGGGTMILDSFDDRESTSTTIGRRFGEDGVFIIVQELYVVECLIPIDYYIFHISLYKLK